MPPPDMAAAGAVTVLGESLLTLEAIQKRFVAPRVPWFTVPRIEKGGKEAKLTMDLAAAFQPWDALKNSKIWQARTEESDARHVLDTPNILAAAFEKDWFYVRPKVCRFVKDEKQLDGAYKQLERTRDSSPRRSGHRAFSQSWTQAPLC